MMPTSHIDYYCFHVESHAIDFEPMPSRPVIQETQDQICLKKRVWYALSFTSLAATDFLLTDAAQKVFKNGFKTQVSLTGAQQFLLVLGTISLVQAVYCGCNKSPLYDLQAKIHAGINAVCQIIAIGLLISEN